MQFPSMLKNTRSSQSVDCSVLLDSGATACFLSTNVASALHLTVHTNPSPMSATTADGRDVTFQGYAYVSVHLKSFASPVKCWVGDIGDHSLILGDPFFVQHKVILDWGALTATIKQGTRSIVLAAEHLPGAFTPSKLSIKTITAKQFAKLAAKPAYVDQCFIVRVTPCDTNAAAPACSLSPLQQSSSATDSHPRAEPLQCSVPAGSSQPPGASCKPASNSSASSSPFLMQQAQLDSVLSDFKDLFPDDLPHLAPHRDLGDTVPTFTIPIEPNTHPSVSSRSTGGGNTAERPVAERPYRALFVTLWGSCLVRRQKGWLPANVH
jgi:hypothetical protein